MLVRQVESHIPTAYGEFRIIAYAENELDPSPHIALVRGPIDIQADILVRIHSECLTGDIFGSERCDCGPQLHKALDMIGAQGGILLYLRQEGRGIGIINKLRAYQLQDQGIDTAAANTHLGFKIDERSYEEAVMILEDLGVRKLNLLTNNPEKIKAFSQGTIQLKERIPLVIEPVSANEHYLLTKKNIMGHLLDL
jgi:GTP cyclohydrolase II